MAKDRRHEDLALEVERSYEPDDDRIRRLLDLVTGRNGVANERSCQLVWIRLLSQAKFQSPEPE